MKLKQFQRADLARAALHDGLVLSWDTGLGKTWAIYLWLLLKVGYTAEEIVGSRAYFPPKTGRPCVPTARRLRPKAPVLIIAPGDLHQQIVDEGWERFGIVVFPLDSQTTFGRECRSLHSAQSNTDAQGRPVLAPDFYITSYTQLTTNGVDRLPDARDWADATALRQLLALPLGQFVSAQAVADYAEANNIGYGFKWDQRPDLTTASEFFAWRGLRWANAYHQFGLDPLTATTATLEAAYEREVEATRTWRDPKAAAAARAKLAEGYDQLKPLLSTQPDPALTDLTDEQQDYLVRHFCAERLERYAANDGFVQPYEQLEDGTWRKPSRAAGAPAADAPIVVQTRQIKCIYSPSLSDLCYNAFRGVAIDEGVKIKGADTYVGTGVRQMAPEYRLVLTATPIKNRVPDIFLLAHWATGGKPEAHARFPFKAEDLTTFAETFMVSEQNLTRQAAAQAAGERTSSSRYKKLTAEVCNVHRLWKLLGPVVLRRRKDDCGEDIVPKIRKVIRCKMGTRQADVIQYHMNCTYEDINGDDAIGARLQALRIAAADPSSLHLKPQPGNTSKACACTQQPVPADTQRLRLERQRESLLKILPELATPATGKEAKETKDGRDRLAAIAAELANPVTRFDTIPAQKDCPHCHSKGLVPLPPRSGQPFIPKHASVLALIEEILARGEQVVVGSAFNDPLDHLSRWLTEAQVRHLKLDGRTSQVKRGKHAAIFKRGRAHHGPERAIPVMLAGVECMAEGHSFHLANNVILLAYSWAFDKFIQFINRVHRMTSAKPVNVYVVICDGTIDRKLESLIQEKGDSAELVLDGRLIGERSEEVNLAELLKVAQREFNASNDTLDEALVHAQWPALRQRLQTAMAAWDQHAPVIPVAATVTATAPAPVRRLSAPARPPLPAYPPAGTALQYDPVSKRYVNVAVLPTLPPPPPAKVNPPAVTATSASPPPPSASAPLLPTRRARVMVVSTNLWDQL